MIITISGNIGAGKTTLAGRLANALNYEQLYMGGIFRQMAAEKGVSIEDFYRTLREDPAAEQEVDRRQAELMRVKDDLIVQGRISWYFAKSCPFPVFNIFLAVEPAIGAERSARVATNAGRRIDEMRIATADREKQERERYRMLYGIKDYYDHSHYDFILDTSHLSINEVSESVMRELHPRLEGHHR